MKRALAIAVALCTLGIVGFGQPALSGSWDVDLCLDGDLASTLELTYGLNGLDITGTASFTDAGLDDISFAMVGAFGPFTIDAAMYFDVAAITYAASSLSTAFDFGGIAIGLDVYHWLPGYYAWLFPYDVDPCQTYDAGMWYVLTAELSPFSLTTRFLDCCTGIEFYDLTAKLSNMGLCCGITYTAELNFTKATGFGYVKFSGINVPLCCGVSVDIAVTFTTTTKELKLTPKFAGLGEGCFVVWGGPLGEWEPPTVVWNGLEIYGFKISCTLGECNEVTFINAFNVTEVNKKLAKPDKFSAVCGEFEMMKVTFCGTGCCGGQWDVALRMFFGTDGGIFDLTRFVYSVDIPLMENFDINFTGTLPAFAGCATASFCVGWTLTF